jgi:hypothetical protein
MYNEDYILNPHPPTHPHISIHSRTYHTHTYTRTHTHIYIYQSTHMQMYNENYILNPHEDLDTKIKRVAKLPLTNQPGTDFM